MYEFNKVVFNINELDLIKFYILLKKLKELVNANIDDSYKLDLYRFYFTKLFNIIDNNEDIMKDLDSFNISKDSIKNCVYNSNINLKDCTEVITKLSSFKVDNYFSNLAFDKLVEKLNIKV